MYPHSWLFWIFVVLLLDDWKNNLTDEHLGLWRWTSLYLTGERGRIQQPSAWRKYWSYYPLSTHIYWKLKYFVNYQTNRLEYICDLVMQTFLLLYTVAFMEGQLIIHLWGMYISFRTNSVSGKLVAQCMWFYLNHHVTGIVPCVLCFKIW